MRVRLLVDRVEVRWHRCARTAEAGEREIERVPEEMNGTRLSAVPARELLEHLVRPLEDVPEALDRISVVRGMLAVLRERSRHRHAEGLLADRDVDAERREGCVQLLVELGDREPVDELERLHFATVGRDHQAVIDEVEVDLEGDTSARVQATRRQPAHVDVERDVPPVVAWRGGGHPHLADDLRPQVQGLLRLLPRCQRKLGELPSRLRHDHGPQP